MSKLIYVVDDEKEICELLRIAFESREYRVETGYNGEMALKMIKRKKPDLLILDLKMPKLNGYEVLNFLKGSDKYSDIPIMVLTSLTKGTRKSDADWKKSLEVDDFITKPFDPLDILKRAQKII